MNRVKDVLKNVIVGIFKHCLTKKGCHEYQRGISSLCAKLALASLNIRETPAGLQLTGILQPADDTLDIELRYKVKQNGMFLTMASSFS